MLTSLFREGSSSVELTSILICTLTSILLGFVIALTHKKTSHYNKDFLITLTVLPILVQVVMIMVNGNLGTSVAIAGAFSLIRFRSVPGTSKEILSVFFAMSIGIATGMGHILFAAIITIITSFVIYILSNTKLFFKNSQEKILKIAVPENLDYTTMFNEVFEKFTKNYVLEQAKTTNMGSLFDLSYRIILKDAINEKEFIDELRIRNGNLKVVLSHPIEGNDM